MSTNKNAQLRYQILDRCFSNFQRYYEIGDLLDEVNERLCDLYGSDAMIKERQLREDIRFMRERHGFDAPIKAYDYNGKRCYYRYEDEDFSIFKNELSPEELTNLRSTLEMLGRYRGIPNYAWLEEVVSNLEYRFGVRSNTENVVSFEQNEKLKGLEFLSDIIDATVNHQPLEIRYVTFKGKEILSVVHPYHVKQFNNRWFLFGMEESENGVYISNKALDRIQKIFSCDKEFIKNTFIDFSTFFDDIVGVTHPKEKIIKETVILQFDADRFPYVLNKPIHHSQKVLNEKEYKVSIEVRPNKELEALIFSYGPQVEVLSPEWFRTQIYKKIEENLKKYSSMQKDCIDDKELCSVVTESDRNDEC